MNSFWAAVLLGSSLRLVASCKSPGASEIARSAGQGTSISTPDISPAARLGAELICHYLRMEPGL